MEKEKKRPERTKWAELLNHAEVIFKRSSPVSWCVKPKSLWWHLSADGMQPNPSPVGASEPMLKAICGY